MFRDRFIALIRNKRSHPYLKKISRLMIIIGVAWILTFPFVARDVFTSENALNVEFLTTNMTGNKALVGYHDNLFKTLPPYKDY